MALRRLRPLALTLALLALPAPAQIPVVAEMPARASTPLVAHVERPRTYDVAHYVIDLRFDERTGSIAGKTTVRLAPLGNGFRDLALDAADLAVSDVRLENGVPLRFTMDDEAQSLNIALDRSYDAGQPIGVVVTYSATPRRGIYFFKAAGAPNATPAQFWSQGETNDSHYWFPCWDYPNDKATSDILMTINRRWVGVSNGALVDVRQNGDGTKTLHWRQSEPNATYLTAVAAGDFVEIRDSWRGRPVSYIVPRSKRAAARRMFKRTPQMMDFFSRRIGYDYPWPKYAQIAVTHFMFGGMENTSATTLADTSVRDALPAYSESPDALVAHELAHQWWGDLVTCRDWAHAWLNEGFATYFALLWTEHDKGRAALRKAVDSTTEEFMRSPVSLSRPLVYNVYRQPFDLFFDGVMYPKGALVLHMLRHVVGDDAFFAGLRDYARTNAFGSVTTDDLESAMEQASGQDLSWFFEEWTRRPGYPVFAVQHSWDDASHTLRLTVRQTQDAPDVPVFRMPVDVRIGTRSGPRTERVVVDARENTFEFALDGRPRDVSFDPDGWVLKKLEQ